MFFKAEQNAYIVHYYKFDDDNYKIYVLNDRQKH